MEVGVKTKFDPSTRYTFTKPANVYELEEIGVPLE